MARTDSRLLLYIENDMAVVATGLYAVERLEARYKSLRHQVRYLAAKSTLSLDEIDAIAKEGTVIADELRLVEAGLAAGRRGLQAQREEA